MVVWQLITQLYDASAKLIVLCDVNSGQQAMEKYLPKVSKR